MNVLVCVKRVPLTGGKITLTDDERAIQTRHLGFTVSPHEECGAEEAVRLIEQHGGTSAVLTLGPPEAEEQLRDLMAIGVDSAIHLVTDGAEWDPQATAPAIVDAVRQQPDPPDLILFGNESADAGNYQVRDPRRPRARTAVRDRGQGDRGRRLDRPLRAGGARRPRRLRGPDAGGGDGQGGHQPPALPIGPGPAAGEAKAAADAHARPRPTPGSSWSAWRCPRGRPSRPRCWATAPTPRPQWSRC